MTSLLDKNIDEIKELYWKRWKVETNFKFLKYNLSLLNSNVKSEMILKQDVSCCSFICNFIAFINKLLNIKKDHKLNESATVSSLIEKVLKCVIYDNNEEAINKIMDDLKILEKEQIKIILNRSYKRKKERPDSNWCQSGHKFFSGPKKVKIKKDKVKKDKIKKTIPLKIKKDKVKKDKIKTTIPLKIKKDKVKKDKIQKTIPLKIKKDKIKKDKIKKTIPLKIN